MSLALNPNPTMTRARVLGLQVLRFLCSGVLGCGAVEHGGNLDPFKPTRSAWIWFAARIVAKRLPKLDQLSSFVRNFYFGVKS